MIPFPAVLAASGLLLAAPALAQTLSPTAYHCRFVRVPVRDGIHLNTSVCRPDGAEGLLPFLLTRTPYGIAGDTVVPESYRFFAADGYIFVSQDVRGRWMSEGEFVNVRLRLYVDQDALVVPASAVVSGQQGSFVFVIQPDSSAATRPVTVARTAGDVSIVTGDVKPGDRVVTDGQLRLRQGSKVQIKVRADSARAGAS